jgi:hypothetical protein
MATWTPKEGVIGLGKLFRAGFYFLTIETANYKRYSIRCEGITDWRGQLDCCAASSACHSVDSGGFSIEIISASGFETAPGEIRSRQV